MTAALRRPPLSALLLLEFAAQRGLPEEQALRSTGLQRADLEAPAASVAGDQELALIASVVRQLGDPPGLGLAMGQRYHLTSYGIWGFALLSSPTLRSAIETGLRYLDLTYSYLRLQLQEQAGETRLQLDATAVPAELRRFLVERDMAAFVVIAREVYAAPIGPYPLRFAFPAPPDPRPYIELFGQMPEFDAAETSVLLPARWLQAPLPQANPLAARLSEAQCRQLLAARRALGGTAALVRDSLLRGIGEGRLPDMDQVAAELRVTSRTLRRRLQAEGSSYRGLLDELRQTLAEELMGTAGLKVDEVAVRLGYSEAASFLHARKRWRESARA